jgi:hypothetical protein
MNMGRGCGYACGLSQKGRFALVGFNQVKGNAGGNGQDQAGESCAGTYVRCAGKIASGGQGSALASRWG